MRNMATTTFRTVGRVGCVRIKRSQQSGILFVAFWNPAKRAMVARSCHTTSMRAATREASAMDKALARNPSARLLISVKLTVAAAVAETINTARTRNAATRRTLTDQGRYLVGFLMERYPGVRLWHQVTNDHLRAYAASLVAEGLAAKTVSNYTSFAVQVSRHIAAAHASERIYFPLQKPANIVAGGAPKRPVKYLSGEDLLFLLDAARTADPRTEILLLLSGVCGLRLSEVARLPVSAFDPGARTLDVRDTKNAASVRVLPLPGMVFERLMAAVGRLADGVEWLMPGRGTRHCPTYRAGDWLRPWLRELAAAADAPHLAAIDPKDLRKTAFNLLRAAGVEPEWRALYCGHAATTMAGRHYEDRGSARMIEQIRREIVAPLEEHLATLAEKKLARAIVRWPAEPSQTKGSGGVRVVTRQGLEPVETATILRPRRRIA